MYDIADLYKAEVVIPLAFEVAAQAPQDTPSVMRRRVRMPWWNIIFWSGWCTMSAGCS